MQATGKGRKKVRQSLIEGTEKVGMRVMREDVKKATGRGLMKATQGAVKKSTVEIRIQPHRMSHYQW